MKELNKNELNTISGGIFGPEMITTGMKFGPPGVVYCTIGAIGNMLFSPTGMSGTVSSVETETILLEPPNVIHY